MISLICKFDALFSAIQGGLRQPCCPKYHRGYFLKGIGCDTLICVDCLLLSNPKEGDGVKIWPLTRDFQLACPSVTIFRVDRKPFPVNLLHLMLGALINKA
jgi:hypothetical protein